MRYISILVLTMMLWSCSATMATPDSNDFTLGKVQSELKVGMNSSEVENVANEKVNVIKISPKNTVSKIELIEPSDTLSPISKFLKTKGQGMHHIALEVDNIYNAIEYLKYKRIKLIYDSPNKGADNKLITFIHPSCSPGILIEICQNK